MVATQRRDMVVSPRGPGPSHGISFLQNTIPLKKTLVVSTVASPWEASRDLAEWRKETEGRGSRAGWRRCPSEPLFWFLLSWEFGGLPMENFSQDLNHKTKIFLGAGLEVFRCLWKEGFHRRSLAQLSGPSSSLPSPSLIHLLSGIQQPSPSPHFLTSPPGNGDLLPQLEGRGS